MCEDRWQTLVWCLIYVFVVYACMCESVQEHVYLYVCDVSVAVVYVCASVFACVCLYMCNVFKVYLCLWYMHVCA